MTAPISLEQLNNWTRAHFVSALGDVVEHSSWVAEAVADARPFESISELYKSLSAALTQASPELQLAVIKAHPDLAAKTATLTADSAAEQASAGLDSLTEAETARIHSLNHSYRDSFGFPFIICARRHTKDSILRQLERRQRSNVEDERTTAIKEILLIIALRLDERIRGRDRLQVHGRLTTHVLDVHGGRPASGVAIELLEVSDTEQLRSITRNVTNADGRTDTPLIDGRPLPIGQYELRFAIGDYYALAKIPSADPPFIGVIPVRFSIAQPDGYYHVPLLCTPWSYSTYRGS